VIPRKKYEDPTIVLYQAKDHLPNPNKDDLKQSYVDYFMTVYPMTNKTFWRKLPMNELRTLYENLEIWYNYPGHPEGSQPIRSAFRPFYRIPKDVNLQQHFNHKGFPDNSWVEVYHVGNMNTDFDIPPELFAGTFYYVAKGSGVFLPMGRTLVAMNKIDALKKLKVPNEIIKTNAGEMFLSWLNREEKRLIKQHPEMTPKKISTLALTTQINAMASGQNKIKIKTGEKECYYGLGNAGDGLLAKAALKEGYDTIQLIHEAQMGCDKMGVRSGFEIIDLRNPLASTRLLRMKVPQGGLRPPSIPSLKEGGLKRASPPWGEHSHQ
jgi:hypothetical protein